MSEPTVFDLSRAGRRAWSLPDLDVPAIDPAQTFGTQARNDNDLPELTEADIARHFVRLSTLNHHVDRGFYPLGSCTMKYNPKVNEVGARLSGLGDVHPLLPEAAAQGVLRLMHELGEYLKEITGFDAVTLQPGAGAHGELAGIMGEIDPAALERQCTDCVACLMVTNPNTLGIFESRARDICAVMHDKGALVYVDGANLNSHLGIHRPGDADFDCMHINLHKTFATPHGGGGPGAGPVVVNDKLAPFLPMPVVTRNGERYGLDFDRPDSIGRLLSFHGHFGVMVKAWTYIRMLGAAGLKDVAENAVLNANYIRAGLEGVYDLPYTERSLHEVVFSGTNLKQHGIRTLDVAKRLLDFGIHAPTVYFPLIVPEALMIEPTETESRETLDRFITAMKQIAEEASENPDLLREAPTRTPVRRLDEARASRQLDVNWTPDPD
jgi:glycine dehydrogenase subunit 2